MGEGDSERKRGKRRTREGKRSQEPREQVVKMARLQRGKAGEREANLSGLERVRVWGRSTERSQNSVEGTWDAEVFGQGLSPLTHVS